MEILLLEYSSKNVYFFSRVKERQIEGTEFKGNETMSWNNSWGEESFKKGITIISRVNLNDKFKEEKKKERKKESERKKLGSS